MRLLIGLCFAATAALVPFERAYGQGTYSESGRFFVQNFSPRDYEQHNANWAVVQDGSGLVYIGNTNGVMTFDGASWRLTPTDNRSTARSLDVDAKGRVYVGARRELGYLAPDSTGAPRYVSLLDRLAEEDRDFTDVWQTFATPEGVYFMTPERLFRWSEPGGFQVWKSSTAFHVSFLVRDTLYVRQRGVGLLRMTDRGLRLVTGGEIFRDEEVFALLPYGAHQMIAVTRTMGIQRYDGTTFIPLATDADDFLSANQIYHGSVLPGGRFALGTLRGGVAVIDGAGSLLYVLDKSAGLRDQKVWYSYLDRDGGLWLALDDGLSRVDIASPITFFSDADGLEGWVGHVIRHRGRLHAATGLGVYELLPADGRGTPAYFEAVPGIPASCWILTSTEEGLLAGCQDRTYLFDGRTTPVVHEQGTGFSMARSRTNPDWILQGMSDGLVKLRLDDGRWTFAGRVAAVSEQIYSIVEEPDGDVWLGTNHEGVLRLRFEDDLREPPRVERYDGRNGLPEGWVNVYAFQDGVLFGTENGLYRYDEFGRFTPDSTLDLRFADGSREVFVFTETGAGNVRLYSSPDVLFYNRRPDGAFVKEPTPLRRLPPSQVYTLLAEPDEVMWVGRTDGLIRLDPAGRAADRPSSAVVRQVTALDDDALIFGGDPATYQPAVLPFTRNSLRFSYALPRYEDVAATRYQYRLDGFDADWSAWTSDFQKDYTNLAEGSYEFRVRARDAYGRISPVAAYAVTVLPPWYRVWWAYVVYILFGVGLVAALVRWRSHRLEQQKQALQMLVARRTEEIEQQRKQLAEQARQLQELDELKTRFFANVSHEFRTPLTLTIGPLSDVTDGLYGSLRPDLHGQVDLALRNARRLLRLTDQLLDVSKIESGAMTLQAERGDVAAFVRSVANAFGPLAERSRIRFDVDVTDTAVFCRFDPEQMEKVIANLLSNAFKFTPEGGRLRVLLQTNRGSAPARAEIIVSDSGPGIPSDDLPHIFERFYQSGKHVRRKGTGIGLSLAREIAELHGGGIEVENGEGAGASFTVHLPLDDAEDLDSSPAASADPTCGTVTKGRDEPPAENDGAEPVAAGLLENGGPSSVPDHVDATTVLIADDNDEMRTYLRGHLEHSYRIVEAGTGRAALELARKTLPDVIVCDVMMPGMDGYELCEAVKQDPALDFIPVVLLTARAAREDRIEGWREGADAYLTKPFDMSELHARIENLLASRRLMRDSLRMSSALHLEKTDVVSADEAYLNGIREAVEQHLGDPDFTVEALASEIGQSRVQLYRRLQELVGKSPSDLIRGMRIERSRHLLQSNAGNISEIAYSVGFKSVSHFSKTFREATGTSPTEYLSRRPSPHG